MPYWSVSAVGQQAFRQPTPYLYAVVCATISTFFLFFFTIILFTRINVTMPAAQIVLATLLLPGENPINNSTNLDDRDDDEKTSQRDPVISHIIRPASPRKVIGLKKK